MGRKIGVSTNPVGELYDTVKCGRIEGGHTLGIVPSVGLASNLPEVLTKLSALQTWKAGPMAPGTFLVPITVLPKALLIYEKHIPSGTFAATCRPPWKTAR